MKKKIMASMIAATLLGSSSLIADPVPSPTYKEPGTISISQGVMNVDFSVRHNTDPMYAWSYVEIYYTPGVVAWMVGMAPNFSFFMCSTQVGSAAYEDVKNVALNFTNGHRLTARTVDGECSVELDFETAKIGHTTVYTP